MFKVSAILSPCRTWRYKLERIWQPNLPVCVWIMLNPSKADEAKDDATIRRCIGFSMRWGFGGIEVYNLFAFRATCPGNLLSVKDPVGPANDDYLRSIPNDRTIITAWGFIPCNLPPRDIDVLKILKGKNLECLGMTITGFPRHPVRLSYSTSREKYDCWPKEKP